MSTPIDQLRQFAYRRDRHNSIATREDRVDMLMLCAKQLTELGFTGLSIEGLESVHVEALLMLWQSQGLSRGTLGNRLTSLRWWATMIGKPHLVAPTSKAYGLPPRQYAPQARQSPKASVPADLPTKICRRCFKRKLLVLFTKNRHTEDGYTAECLECHRIRAALYDFTHREQKHAYDATHKPERRQREASREERWSQALLDDLLVRGASGHHIKQVEYSQYKIPRRGVYIMQLLARANTCKIGCSTDMLSRVRQLWAEHGPFRCLLVIPYAAPFKGERVVHEFFASMRIYDGGSPRELFVFDTRAKQKRLERFLATFATFCVEPLAWEICQPQRKREPLQQPRLFD